MPITNITAQSILTELTEGHPDRAANAIEEILGILNEYPENLTFARFLEEYNSDYKELQLRLDKIYYNIIIWEGYITLERMYFFNNMEHIGMADAKCIEYILYNKKDIMPVFIKLEELTQQPTPPEWWDYL